MSAYIFSSPICPPCKELKPVFEDLKEEFSSLQWKHVNIKADPEGLTQKFGVKFVPTIVAISSTGVVHSHTGTNVGGYYKILRQASQQE
jgi:thioredoxin-like negative regulator of GroEL